MAQIFVEIRECAFLLLWWIPPWMVFVSSCSEGLTTLQLEWKGFFFFLFKWKLLGKWVAECLYRTRSVLLQLINLFEGLLWTTGIWINAFIFLNYISSVHNELLLSIKARIGRRNLGVGKSPADRGVGLCCLNIFKWMGFSCQGES